MIRKLILWLIPASEGVQEIGKQMIENPTDWVQGMYEYTNKKNPDIAIWTCNGIPFIKIGGFGGLTLSDKIYLGNAIKISIANRLKYSLTDK